MSGCRIQAPAAPRLSVDRQRTRHIHCTQITSCTLAHAERAAWLAPCVSTPISTQRIGVKHSSLQGEQEYCIPYQYVLHLLPGAHFQQIPSNDVILSAGCHHLRFHVLVAKPSTRLTDGRQCHHLRHQLRLTSATVVQASNGGALAAATPPSTGPAAGSRPSCQTAMRQPKIPWEHR